MNKKRVDDLRSPRLWMALAVLLAAYLFSDLFESNIYHLVAHAIGIKRNPPNTLQQASYGLRMLVRLTWDAGLWIAICFILRHSPLSFPLSDKRYKRHISIGLATGVAVMLATMSGIWLLRSAGVSFSGQTLSLSVQNGSGWLLLDFVGALGEEIYGRAIVLILAERLFGRSGSIFISGLMFSGLHLSNPGAAWLWLLRLFLQGSLLAYAVFRTQSLWWSVGYHTGWNWVSAPLFGAAGSGYMDEGHILNFYPKGSVWITGGNVGPEGSVLALLAVLAAFGLLLIATNVRVPEALKLAAHPPSKP